MTLPAIPEMLSTRMQPALVIPGMPGVIQGTNAERTGNHGDKDDEEDSKSRAKDQA